PWIFLSWGNDRRANTRSQCSYEVPQLGRRRRNSGSLAILAAIRRAFVPLSSLAADRRPGTSSKETLAHACPVPSLTMRQAGPSSTDQGPSRHQLAAGIWPIVCF